MKKYNYHKTGGYISIGYLRKVVFLIVAFMLISGYASIAQDMEEEMSTDKPVRATFNSAWLIDNQSVMVPIKGTFEFDISHRFGKIGNGYEDLFGLYASSNIRLGFTYAPIENLSVGFGLTKYKNFIDFNAKYALVKQTRSDRIPLSVTYFGNMGIDTRKESNREEVYHTTDRYSYFHQLIVARKFSPWLSLQLAGSISHYNMIAENFKNDHFAISGGGKVKINETLSCIFNVDQPITKHTAGNPNPNLSLGVEMSTSSHAFQIFLGNYQYIIPQENNVYNSNNYEDNFGDNFLIGFNITRLWNW